MATPWPIGSLMKKCVTLIRQFNHILGDGSHAMMTKSHFTWLLLIAIFFVGPAFSRPADVVVVPRGQTFTCTPTMVWDGDGPIWCEEGPTVRLAGIAAREMDGSCSPGHPCPTASAESARDALVQMLGTPSGFGRNGHIQVTGPSMQCQSEGFGVGRRTAAWCTSPVSGNINCAMVRGGWALKWERYWKDYECA